MSILSQKNAPGKPSFAAPCAPERIPFAALANQAEGHASQLLGLWAEYGRRKSSLLRPAQFPTHRHADAAQIIMEATGRGIYGWPSIALEILNEDQRLAFTSTMGEAALSFDDRAVPGLEAKLAEFHRHKRQIELGQEIGRRAAEGESFDDLAAELSKVRAEGGGFAFEITRASDCGGVAQSYDFVQGLLTEGGASVIYGPSNCGKSFWALDLAACVATGRRFRDDLEVDQGAVVYLGLEGRQGLQNRIEALRVSGLLDDSAPLYLVFAPVSLLEADHAERLAASVRQAAEQASLPCRLVIVDTLARAMAGGDENAGKDMTSAVGQLDAIRAATGAHVSLIHHCGKDEARGARGHSSLRAAVDTEIEVSRPEGETVSTVRVTKQRDLPAGPPMPFSLHAVNLGLDRRGNPITSCTVHHEDEIMAASKGKAGRPPAATDDEILALLPQVSTASWQRAANDELGVSKSAFHRIIKTFRGSKAVKQSGGGWVRK